MASIQKRSNSYAVVYRAPDGTGEKKQTWETFPTLKQAQKRKAEIELALLNNNLVINNGILVKDFMLEFIDVYGTKKWGVSTYKNNVGLINNYIIPILGSIKVQDVNPKCVDMFIKTLQKTAPVMTVNRKPKNEFLPPSNIEKIYKLMLTAFKQAVRWEIINRNPFENTIRPTVEKQQRDMWTSDMIKSALTNCSDSKLYLAINLAFACSLRMGEILGLTWDNIHVSDHDIKNDNAHLNVEKELRRVSKDAMEELDYKDILFIFPDVMENTKTSLVFKKPKTQSSIRKVWIPETVAYMLRDWKQSQNRTKQYLGSDYEDYNIVVALGNGRPCQQRTIEDAFNELKIKSKLPNVVFHSLRHSSTTYKLKLNNGDLKSVQGDTGHAEIDMITKVYAHILDEDRKINAQKFNDEFYTTATDLRNTTVPSSAKLDMSEILEQLKNAPEFTKMLAELVAG